MWLILKLLIGARLGLLILAFFAVFIGFMVMAIGDMRGLFGQSCQHRFIQHNIEDSHRLRDWRLK